MKIAHVIHTFPPDSRAGSENYVEVLAREQQRQHEVAVFHRVDRPDWDEYETREGDFAGLPVVRLNRTFRDLRSFAQTYRNDAVAAAFGDFLDRWRPDRVHFHHVSCLSTTWLNEAHRRGIPVLFTLHDFWLLCPRGQRLRRDLTLCERHSDTDCVRCMAHQLSIRGGHARVRALWKRAELLAGLRLPAGLYRRAASRLFARDDAAVAEIRARTGHVREMCGRVDRFVCPSRFLRDRYVEFGVRPERTEVLSYGYDLERWAKPAPRPERSGPLRVAYIGTWIPSKGVHVLVEAFREIDPEHAELDVHGYAVPYDGFDGYEAHLRGLAGDAPHIRFRGPYQPDDVPGLLAAADVVVVPSIWWENSPLTIHEAFLAGLPVVVSDHGGMRELVGDGRGGLTFAPGRPAALRGCLERLAGDRALLARLAAARPPVKSIERNAAELEAAYRAVESG